MSHAEYRRRSTGPRTPPPRGLGGLPVIAPCPGPEPASWRIGPGRPPRIVYTLYMILGAMIARGQSAILSDTQQRGGATWHAGGTRGWRSGSRWRRRRG